jgi:PPOX class probable F420-dependent enzyme
MTTPSANNHNPVINRTLLNATGTPSRMKALPPTWRAESKLTYVASSPRDPSRSHEGGRMEIPPAVREVLESAALAHVATVDADGKPQVTVAWAGLDGDEIVMATLPDQRKLHNMRRDPRVTLSFETERVNDWGLREYLVVYGRARITEGGAAELLQELAHTYLGPEVVFPGMPDPPPGFITHVTPERLGGVGPWKS